MDSTLVWQEAADAQNERSKPLMIPINSPDTTPSNTKQESTRLELLEERLYSSHLLADDGSYFIPRGTLKTILEQDTIRLVLEESFPAISKHSLERYVREICCQVQPFRNIFAVLVLSGTIESIANFVDFGVDDSHLPMPDPRPSGSLSVRNSADPIQRDDEEWRFRWNRVFKRMALRHKWNFFDRQWAVLAPVFESVGKAKHYTFCPMKILPFLDIGHDTTLGSHIMSLSQSTYGGYSTVRMITIHPDHYNFGDYGIDNPKHVFALKRLHTQDERLVWQEVNVLKRFRNVEHIIQLLASYEFKGEYCLIFPWSSGNLESLWQSWESSGRDFRIAPWISSQCFALVQALSKVHRDSDDLETSNVKPLYGRHGDIKPSNILWFLPPSTDMAEDMGQLALADFGLADLRSETSRSDVDASEVAISPTYQAPGFDMEDGKVSRKTDIWMLGCTFLEFVTWFLMGFDAVINKFREVRSESDILGIYTDTFFRIVDLNGRSVGMVKPQVKAWIAALHEHDKCSDYVHDFLELIEHHMLVANPKDRMPASDLSRSLEEISLRCQDSPEYFQVPHPWCNKEHQEDPQVGRSRSSFEGGTTNNHHMDAKVMHRIWKVLRPGKRPSVKKG